MQEHKSRQDFAVRLMEADKSLLGNCCIAGEDSPKTLILMTNVLELTLFIQKHLDTSKLSVSRFAQNTDGSLKEKSGNVLEAFADSSSKAAGMMKKLKDRRATELGPCEVNLPEQLDGEDAFGNVLTLLAGEQSVTVAFSSVVGTLVAERYKAESQTLKKILTDLKVKAIFADLDNLTAQDKPINTNNPGNK